MDSTYPDPSLIGKAFVKQYYTQLHHDPSQMHRFYLEQSSMIHGGSELGSAERVIGQKAIHEKILSMDLQQVHAKIKQVDSDLTLGQGITIQVTGELSTAGKPMRAFVQTFVLAPESPKKYYVRNDFFRYQDDDLISEGEANDSPGEVDAGGEQAQDHIDTYHHQQPTNSGMAAAEVIKGDSTVYGSPGANLVAMGDQGLQEEGGTMGAASGWGQFPNADPGRLTEVQQNGLPAEEEAMAEVPAQAVTPLTPATSSVVSAAAQPELPPGHLPGESEVPVTEPAAYTAMDTQEPEATKGTWADRLSRGFGTSAAPKTMHSSVSLPQSAPPRQAAPPTAALPQQRGGGGDTQRKRMDRTPPVKDGPPPRKMGGGGGRDVPDSCQLFVGGLPPGTTEGDLREVFSPFGTILEVRLNQKNFAFVVFGSQEAVQKVLSEREGIQIRSKSLNIELKRPSVPRSGGANRGKPGVSSAGGGGGGGGGGRYRNSKPPKR